MLRNAPKVLVFGWLGAKDYHMNIIKKFYQDVGLETHSVIQSYSSILGIYSNKTKINETLKYAQGSPIMCHIFSLNGFSAFFKTLADENLKIKPGLDIRGFVLDSTPSHVDHNLYYRAFSQAMFPKSPRMARIASYSLRPAFDLFLTCAKKHKAEASRQTDFIFTHPFKQPQLVIGSEKDTLIPNEEVRKYVDVAIKNGANVQTKFYPDSGHIRLYKDHRSEYRTLVQNFALNLFKPKSKIATPNI